jgi:hypothetical protein
MKWILAWALALSGTAAGDAAQNACYDLSKDQPSSLAGELHHRILPGPPNYEDVQAGDHPEPTYLLQLDADICLRGDEDFADPELRFRRVHVVPGDGLAQAMASLIGNRVIVSIVDRWAAHTGHHRAPLVAVVGSIAAEEDVTSEYGTAATVVRAFYQALGAGNGVEAARFIVPEKAAKGPLSAASLSSYYGNMDERLELLSLRKKSDNTFLVSYAFRKSAKACSGRAEVRTENRGGKEYIQRIKALDGC